MRRLWTFVILLTLAASAGLAFFIVRPGAPSVPSDMTPSGMTPWDMAGDEGAEAAEPATAEASDRTRDGLVGPVQRVVTETAPLIERFGEWVEAARELESVTLYDEAGRVLEASRYTGNVLDYRLVTLYDDTGRPLSETSFDAAGEVLYKWLYDYEDGAEAEGPEVGERTVLSGYNADGSLDYRLVTLHDARGRPLREVAYDPDGSPSMEADFVYEEERSSRTARFFTAASPGNSPGNSTDYSTGNSPDYSTDYSTVELFGAAGRRLEEASYAPDGSLEYRVVYRYDAAGRLLEESAFNAQGALEYRLENVYDAAGNLTELSEYGTDGALFSRYRYAYDARGNVAERSSYHPDGSLSFRFAYAYVYDEAGNWLRRTTSRWVTRFGREYFEPAEVTHRVIGYHSTAYGP